MTKKIKLKPKTSTLYIVLEDNDPWGVLPIKILHFFSLNPDSENEVAEEIYQKLYEEIIKFAWNKLLNFLSYRERSTNEVLKYLHQLPLRSKLAEELMNRAISYNYLNETRFCEMYIEDLQNKAKSRKEIINKLRSKGVSSEIIDTCMGEFFQADKEAESLCLKYEKAQKKFSKYPDLQKREKILNFLTRKGFSYWQVKELLEKE